VIFINIPEKERDVYEEKENYRNGGEKIS